MYVGHNKERLCDICIEFDTTSLVLAAQHCIQRGKFDWADNFIHKISPEKVENQYVIDLMHSVNVCQDRTYGLRILNAFGITSEHEQLVEYLLGNVKVNPYVWGSEHDTVLATYLMVWDEHSRDKKQRKDEDHDLAIVPQDDLDREQASIQLYYSDQNNLYEDPEWFVDLDDYL